MAAKDFGVTEFINPKDHKKPIQEVGYPNSFLPLLVFANEIFLFFLIPLYSF